MHVKIDREAQQKSCSAAMQSQTATPSDTDLSAQRCERQHVRHKAVQQQVERHVPDVLGILYAHCTG